MTASLPLSSLRLGHRLGSGGEGEVFEIEGRAREVAKIYHTRLTGAAGDKLRAQVAVDPGALGAQAAWPTTLLLDAKGEVAGFIMARSQEPFDIHEVYSPRDRLQKLPAADWAFLVRTAQNIAIAFAAAHARGIVIGDVNHGSVRVSKDGLIRLIDCDSMQFEAGGQVYRCSVGVDTYTPPELQGLRLGDQDRTPHHDGFGLAVLVFHLLFLGRHPFAGVPTRKSAPTDIAGAIKAGAFAYGRRGGLLSPPPLAPSLDMVPAELRSLFEEAFRPAAAGSSPERPSARDWFAGLKALGETLRTCGRNPAHSFSTVSKTCPWCAYEQNGLVFFYRPQPVTRVPTGRVDGARLRQAWARFEAKRLNLVRLERWAAAPQPAGKKPGWPALLVKRGAGNVAPWLAAALFLTLQTAFVIAAFVIGGVAILSHELLKRLLRRKTERLRNGLRQLGTPLTPADQQQLRQLDTRALYCRNSAEAQLQAIDQMIRQPASTMKDLQLIAYLEKFRIRPGAIDGIGPSRAAQLASFGIESAADISKASVSAVPGFGQGFTNRLVNWRAQCEKRFRFNPQQMGNQAIAMRLANRRLIMERDFAKHVGELEQMLSRLEAIEGAGLARKSALESQVLALQAEYAQAMADYSLFN